MPSGCPEASSLPPIAPVLENDCDPTRGAAARFRRVPEAVLFLTDAMSSRIKQQRAHRAGWKTQKTTENPLNVLPSDSAYLQRTPMTRRRGRLKGTEQEDSREERRIRR
ncbi:hypothetical protein GBF38_005421 [Nibea albiflora]|uniref:Uncharacterized protein n=1 Tax=Nibea albiflora TaxID=240163 RepID=A0ACB7EZJ6_NIBAL|nr:hypothetical protein GBF38_005421 [Nibea albiflora]